MKFLLNVQFSKKQNGFTLIELLIVITVIGVLTSIVTANFVGIRERSRDSERKADLRQIQTALEFHIADTGSYPSEALYSGTTCNEAMTLGTTTTYMQHFPCDPLNTSTQYTYSVSGSTYTLHACLENERDNQRDASNICTAPGVWSHTVTSP